MQRLFTNNKKTDPADEASKSWWDSLATATGWLNPYQIIRSGVNTFSATALMLATFVQQAPAASMCVSSDYFRMTGRYIPVTTKGVTNWLACGVADQTELLKTLAYQCSAYIGNSIDALTWDEIESISGGFGMYGDSSWIPACRFLSPVAMENADACLLDVLNTTTLMNECHLASLSQDVAVVGVLLGILAGLAATVYGGYRLVSYMVSLGDPVYGPEFKPPFKSLTKLAAEAVAKHPQYGRFFQDCTDDHPHKILIEEAKLRLA